MLDFKRYIIDETTILSTVPIAYAQSSFMENKDRYLNHDGSYYSKEDAINMIERIALYEENDGAIRVIDYPTFKMLTKKKQDIYGEYDVITTILNIKKV